MFEQKQKVDDLIEPDLSYKIVGLCMEIYRQLGNSCKEKYYQRALEVAFRKNDMVFNKEIKVDLGVFDEKIGHYFLDFLVEKRVVVELKAKPFLNKNDAKQVLDYLRATNKKLGLIVNFGKASLEYHRILNSKYNSQS